MLLNAGDIQIPVDFAVDYFLTMAFDIDSFNFKRSPLACRYNGCVICWAMKYRNEYQDVVNSCYKLAFLAHKPKFMGWGYQMDYWQAREENGIRIRIFRFNYQ